MLNEKSIQTLKELTELMAISGDEKEVRDYLKSKYSEYTSEIVFDNLGSVMAIKRSKNPDAKMVMLLGHMDEVGFVVTTINDKGCIGFAPIGGWWSQTLLGQRVIVKNRAGVKFNGTIGSIPPHLLTDADRAKPMELKNMLIDLGFTTKEEVTNSGIESGDAIILDGSFISLNNGKRLLGKAFDNRYSCAMGLEVLEALKDVELDVHLAVGASVQEEVGTRGAQTIAYKIKPDAAIIFDCSPANDASGDKESFGQLGAGPLVRFIDANFLPHRGFINHYVDILESNKIPYQYYQSLGGTDAGAVHRQYEGIMTLTMCLCARNIHTNSSIIDADDYLNAKTVVLKLLETLNSDTIEVLKKANQ